MSFAVWQSFMKEEVPSVLIAAKQGTKKQTLLAHCIVRLRAVLSTTGSQPEISGACRVICTSSNFARCHDEENGLQVH